MSIKYIYIYIYISSHNSNGNEVLKGIVYIKMQILSFTQSYCSKPVLFSSVEESISQSILRSVQVSVYFFIK